MVKLRYYFAESSNISAMKKHLLDSGILDWTNEMVYKIAPEAVDPAILNRGALSYHRYTRSALLLIRDDALSHYQPDCIHDKKLKSLGLWKLNQPNYLEPNTGSGNNINENSTGRGGINIISGGNERRQIGNDRNDNNNCIQAPLVSSSKSQLVQHKNYIDPRSISSSHLMPKFLKSRIVVNSQQQSSSINATGLSNNNNNNIGNMNNYDRNNHHQLSSSGKNDTQEHYSRKYHLDNSIERSTILFSPQISNTISNITSNNKITTGNRIGAIPSHSNINPGYNQHYSDICNNNNDHQKQQKQNSTIPTNLRGAECRIGSGRITFSRDWDYRNNDNNINDINNDRSDYNNSYHRIGGNNINNWNNTRYDYRNFSSQQQQSDYHNVKRSYGRNNDYDNHRNNSDHLHDNNNIANNNQHLNNNPEHNQHHNNNNSNAITHRINNRYRNDNYSSRNDEPEWFSAGPTSQHDTIELRGFDENDDIINASNNNNITQNNNGNRKNSSSSSTDSFQQLKQYINYNKSYDNKRNNNNKTINNDNLINTSNKAHQEKAENNNKKMIDLCGNDDIETVCNNNNNNLPSPPPARSTPTKKLLNNIKNDIDNNDVENNEIISIDNNNIDNNNNDGGENNMNDDKKETIIDDKLQHDFNIDAFLNVDPLINCFGGEPKNDNIVSGSSRFRRWFKTGKNDDDNNGLEKHKINSSKGSSLHEELNNILNDELNSTQQLDKNSINEKYVSPTSPTTTGGGKVGVQQQQQHHNSQQSLFEFLRRGNFNSTHNNGQQISSPFQQQQNHNNGQIEIPINIDDVNNFNKSGVGVNHIYSNIDNKRKEIIPSVEELEARLRKGNNDLGIIQNTLKLNSSINQNNNNNCQLNILINKMNTPTSVDYINNENVQNNQPKEDIVAFKRLLEQITSNNDNSVGNLPIGSSSSTTNLLNDTIQQQQHNLFNSRPDELKRLMFQQYIQRQNFTRLQQQQIIRVAHEILQKSAHPNICNANLNEILKRPEAQALLQGVARGELTQSSLLQLANSTAGGGRYRDVILPILNLLRIPAPLNLNGNNQYGQQQDLAPIPGPISTIQQGSPQRIPSPRELQVHTQSIMQTALIRKKLEEQQKIYRRQQEIQQKLPQHHVNVKWNPTNNPIAINKPMGRPILKGGITNGVQTTMMPPQMSFASKIEFQQLQQQRNKIISGPQQEQQHLSSSGNVLINQIQQQQHLQQIFQQQQRQRNKRAQQQQLPGSVTGTVTGIDNSNNGSNKTVNQRNSQQQPQLNIQSEGGLSPTSNQLARWFSPELLAQASAGKLPALNMGQALSLEEFERSIKHSTAAVHN